MKWAKKPYISDFLSCAVSPNYIYSNSYCYECKITIYHCNPFKINIFHGQTTVGSMLMMMNSPTAP